MGNLKRRELIYKPELQTSFSEEKHDRIVGLVRDQVNYIDTVELWFPWPVNEFQIKEIKDRCLGKVIPRYYSQENPQPYPSKLSIHRPQDDLFEFLDDLPEDVYPCRLDVAIDYITDTFESAREIQKYFELHWIKLWPGKRQLSRFQETIYLANNTGSRPSNNGTVYADKPCRIPGNHFGAPCCHVEWRLAGKTNLRQAGYIEPWDLVDFQHRKFWEKRMNFRFVDFGRLGLMCEQPNSKRRKLRNSDYRHGYRFARHAMDFYSGNNGIPIRPRESAHQIRDYLRHCECTGFGKCIKKFDPGKFLPDG